MKEYSSIKQHFNEHAAAQFLDVTVSSLRDRRYRTLPPIYCKFGRTVRYPVTALSEFSEACTIVTPHG